MTLVHRTAAGTVALTCALAFATAASSRDLFILEAGGVADWPRPRESRRRLPHAAGRVQRPRGPNPRTPRRSIIWVFPNAMQLQASAFGTQVVLSIPSTGFSRTFTGATPDEVENQVEDFFKDDGAKELAKFYEKTNARTAIALLDGNPRSTTALFARSAFDRFGLGALRTRSGYSGEEMGDWGHFDLGIEGGGGVSGRGSLRLALRRRWRADARRRFRPGRGLPLGARPVPHRTTAPTSTTRGLELGIPITVLGPGEGHWLRWVLTPVVQSGGGASQDLLAGGIHGRRRRRELVWPELRPARAHDRQRAALLRRHPARRGRRHHDRDRARPVDHAQRRPARALSARPRAAVASRRVPRVTNFLGTDASGGLVRLRRSRESA